MSSSATSCHRRLILPRGDDFHLHLRDGDELKTYAQTSAQFYRRAIIMPNLIPPVTNAGLAASYRDRVLSALGDVQNPNPTTGSPNPNTSSTNTNKAISHPCFIPLMTLYLTDNTTPEVVHQAKASGFIYAFKLYPAGATTNSASGVTDIKKETVQVALKAMEECGMVLCIHGETLRCQGEPVDPFDREAIFVAHTLPYLLETYPRLKIVLEHITTSEAALAVLTGPDTLAATLTPHHLADSRSALFTSHGLNPHAYCLPVLKAESHRQALLQAIASGHPRLFAGTDSAPHPKTKKECGQVSAGCYTAPISIELYVEAFMEADRKYGTTSRKGGREEQGRGAGKGDVASTASANPSSSSVAMDVNVGSNGGESKEMDLQRVEAKLAAFLGKNGSEFYGLSHDAYDYWEKYVKEGGCGDREERVKNTGMESKEDREYLVEVQELEWKVPEAVRVATKYVSPIASCCGGADSSLGQTNEGQGSEGTEKSNVDQTDGYLVVPYRAGKTLKWKCKNF